MAPMAPPRILGRSLERERRLRARRHRRRRSGDDDLHLRHDGAAEGRAARAPGAARPSAGRADAARVPAAGRRPALDAGRLGLGRRPSRTCSCRASISACRSWRASSRSSIREEAFRLMAEHGVRNTFVPPTALRMLRTVANPARALRSALRTIALGRRGARRRDLRLGPRGARPHDQRVLRPDRVQPRARLLRGDRRREGRAPSASRCRAIAVGVIREDGARCEPGELGQIAVRAAGPGDVPRLLEQARRDARRSSSATG